MDRTDSGEPEMLEDLLRTESYLEEEEPTSPRMDSLRRSNSNASGRVVSVGAARSGSLADRLVVKKQIGNVIEINPTNGRSGEAGGARKEVPAPARANGGGPRRPRSGSRYFILKSINVANIEQSLMNGVWATQKHNEQKLNEAFHTSESVFLVFSVNMSGHFQGYARMTSAVSQRGPGGHGLWEGNASVGAAFGVEWQRRYDLPFNETEHLRNPLNEGKPIKISRDGQELPADIGEEVLRMFNEAADRAGIPPLARPRPAAPPQHRPRMDGGRGPMGMRPPMGMGGPGFGPGLGDMGPMAMGPMGMGPVGPMMMDDGFGFDGFGQPGPMGMGRMGPMGGPGPMGMGGPRLRGEGSGPMGLPPGQPPPPARQPGSMGGPPAGGPPPDVPAPRPPRGPPPGPRDPGSRNGAEYDEPEFRRGGGGPPGPRERESSRDRGGGREREGSRPSRYAEEFSPRNRMQPSASGYPPDARRRPASGSPDRMPPRGHRRSRSRSRSRSPRRPRPNFLDFSYDEYLEHFERVQDKMEKLQEEAASRKRRDEQEKEKEKTKGKEATVEPALPAPFSMMGINPMMGLNPMMGMMPGMPGLNPMMGGMMMGGMPGMGPMGGMAPAMGGMGPGMGGMMGMMSGGMMPEDQWLAQCKRYYEGMGAPYNVEILKQYYAQMRAAYRNMMGGRV